MNVAVIGSGIGGLAVAIRLAAKGHQVTVFEKNDRPGGKLSEIREEGYRFDTGPSLFTLPGLIEELFVLCGKKMEDFLPYVRLENNCRYFFPDKTVFNFWQDRDKLGEEVRTKTIEAPATLFKRLKKSEQVYNLGAPVFLFTSFRKLSDFNTAPYKKMVFKLHQLDFFRTMHQANNADFTDKRLVQLFDRYATYNGSSPYKAPATLNMIAHLENNIGAFFPRHGMYSIVESLYRLAQEKGVEFRFNSKVSGIIQEGKKVKGVVYNGWTDFFDCVVSDIDVKQLANNLMEKHPLKKRLNRMEPSSSALIFYWSVGHTFPELDLHNIFFSEDYKKEFTTLFEKKDVDNDPTVYLFISSKIVKEDAPVGCENWFVMVNVPANSGQDWEEIIARTRKNIVNKINKTLNTDIDKYIIQEKVASPLTIEKDTGSMQGALYGISSNSMLSAFMRHPNFLYTIKDIWFVGGSVHPGGGIPLCLASAKIVENEITEKYERVDK